MRMGRPLVADGVGSGMDGKRRAKGTITAPGGDLSANPRRKPGRAGRGGRAAPVVADARRRGVMFLDDEIEILRPQLPRGRFRFVLFDFDGTLSLIREGWPQVMIPMMVEVLRQTGTGEGDAELSAKVEEVVMRLNGKQTIYQMMQLADEVQARGGKPRDPLAYKNEYHELLWQQVGGRIERVRDGRATSEEMTVPGSRRLLEQLRDRGLTLYLASG